MAVSYINTTEMQDIANEMESLVGDFDFEINSIFTRLAGVPDITKEWIGNQSNYYFEKVALDKNDYIAFSDDLKKIISKIRSDADDMQKNIENNRINESE